MAEKLVPTLCVGTPCSTLRVVRSRQRAAARPGRRSHAERGNESRARTKGSVARKSGGVLCTRAEHGGETRSHALRGNAVLDAPRRPVPAAGRRAAREAFPRRAWERARFPCSIVEIRPHSVIGNDWLVARRDWSRLNKSRANQPLTPHSGPPVLGFLITYRSIDTTLCPARNHLRSCSKALESWTGTTKNRDPMLSVAQAFFRNSRKQGDTRGVQGCSCLREFGGRAPAVVVAP